MSDGDPVYRHLHVEPDVHDLQRGPVVQFDGGRPVAVTLSWLDYDALTRELNLYRQGRRP